VTGAYDTTGIEDFADQWLHDARKLGDPWSVNEALTTLAGTPNTEAAIAAGEEALALGRQLAPSRVAFAAVELAANIAQRDPARAKELRQEAAAAANLAGNYWVDHVTSIYLIRSHIDSGDYKAAADTALVAIDRSLARQLPGQAIQFVPYLAGAMANLQSVEAALVTAAWADQHGLPITSDSAYWSLYGGTELCHIRDAQSRAELERMSRTAAALDDSALAHFAWEHLAQLSSQPPEATIR
jgi:hypothetical protein